MAIINTYQQSIIELLTLNSLFLFALIMLLGVTVISCPQITKLPWILSFIKPPIKEFKGEKLLADHYKMMGILIF